MEKHIKLAEKAHCTGCRACSNVCPTYSVKFELKGLHFYPTIDENTCIKCGKCMSVCSPLQWESKHPSGIGPKSKYYCAWNTDAAERHAATSGGIGGAMAELALKNRWYVCGAVFDGKYFFKFTGIQTFIGFFELLFILYFEHEYVY